MVQLVDAHDNPTGTAEKLLAHQQGWLHRAISVVVWNATGQMLLQRRAMGKYHGGGLWANACCSHPAPAEAPEAAARRRLMEEMGLDLPVQPLGTLLYRAEMDNGLIEHEFDHLFTAHSAGAEPQPNPEEVMDYRWVFPAEIEAERTAHPERFAPWFMLILDKLTVEQKVLG